MIMSETSTRASRFALSVGSRFPNRKVPPAAGASATGAAGGAEGLGGGVDGRGGGGGDAAGREGGGGGAGARGGGGGAAAGACGGMIWMVSSGSVAIPDAVAAGLAGAAGGGGGAGAGGGGAAAISAGFSTLKMPLHELQRTFTPPAGTLAESTGNDLEHDGHVTGMTRDRFG
jgi:hypothetical protein